jgi:glycosyltransferase involved in cell wall biosynthesis
MTVHTGSAARVLVFTPDSNAPIGGVKIHYQVVDALNRAGIDALVVHRRPGFRCTWFENVTLVASLDELRVDQHDVLVVPEEWMGFIPELPSEIPKIVFHQNAYTTFSWGLDAASTRDILTRPDVKRVVVVSDDNGAYLRYAFRAVDVRRIHYTIDPSLFRFTPLLNKKRQLAYMPRRRAQDSRDVLSLLRCRDAFDGWSVVSIDRMHEAEVAAHLRESAIFLSFSQREGLPLPPAEAMACGCLVIGFHGFGGRDFGDHGIWIPEGDVVAYAQIVEDVLTRWDRDVEQYRALAEQASTHVRETYCAENTQRDVLSAFMLSTHGVPSGETYELSDSMWQTPPLVQRALGRASRAARVLLSG